MKPNSFLNIILKIKGFPFEDQSIMDIFLVRTHTQNVLGSFCVLFLIPKEAIIVMLFIQNSPKTYFRNKQFGFYFTSAFAMTNVEPRLKHWFQSEPEFAEEIEMLCFLDSELTENVK